MAIGLEKWAVPTPIVKVNRQAIDQMGISNGDVDAMINEAQQQAQAYVVQEQSYLVENNIVSFDTYGGSSGFDANGGAGNAAEKKAALFDEDFEKDYQKYNSQQIKN